MREKKQNENGEVARKWIENLKEKGYEHYKRKISINKLKHFSRTWRRIFKFIKITPYRRNDMSAFEVGFGGGKQIVQFALNDWKIDGVDCSPEVCLRAEKYLEIVKSICNRTLRVGLTCGDFLNYETRGHEGYDMVFNVGVVEHFLNDSERKLFLSKMFELARTDGYIVSVVPNGIHPLRGQMKKDGLGGYNVPEIDYSYDLLKREMKEFTNKEITVVGHNMFGYLLIKKDIYLLRKLFYLFFQAIPISILPNAFIYKHSATLIVIAKK